MTAMANPGKFNRVRDVDINRLDPFTSLRGGSWVEDPQAHTLAIRERFERLYQRLVMQGAHEYHLDRVATGIFYLRTSLARLRITGPDQTAVEIGCGNGSKSHSVCDLFGQYYGFDLQGDLIDQARKRSTELGHNNVQFFSGNAIAMLESGTPVSIADIDVLILYAVLEHMTPNERRTMLQIAGQVISAGGSVVVLEAANRLSPFDSHTTQQHFMNYLPDELAVLLSQRYMERPDLVSRLRKTSPENKVEEMYRQGRGISFHEFQEYLGLSWKDIRTPFDSLSHESVNMTPITSSDITLLQYLAANLQDVPASAFARSWIDAIFCAPQDKGERSCKVYVPSSAGTMDTSRLFWTQPSIDFPPESSWEIPWPDSSGELTILLPHAEPEFHIQLKIDGAISDAVSVEELNASRPPTWHDSHAITWKIDAKTKTVEVKASGDHRSGLGGFIVRSASSLPLVLPLESQATFSAADPLLPRVKIRDLCRQLLVKGQGARHPGPS